ncbi:hypothetical protein BRD00_00625 [Halobacteriales archaeon QS_8_69_26]|nr:MAG: hypothetical protein BRD00_00625 [Halobacteriales archaeon QS_8_69_26]
MGEDWKVTVRSLELATTFRTDEAERTFEMPGGQQLTVATVAVENTSPPNSWAAPMGFVVDGDTGYQTQRSFDHPEFERKVLIRDLRRVEHQHQFEASGFHVDYGETRRLWAVAVLPRSVSRQQVRVGLKIGTGDVEYPVQWIPP